MRKRSLTLPNCNNLSSNSHFWKITFQYGWILLFNYLRYLGFYLKSKTKKQKLKKIRYYSCLKQFLRPKKSFCNAKTQQTKKNYKKWQVNYWIWTINYCKNGSIFSRIMKKWMISVSTWFKVVHVRTLCKHSTKYLVCKSILLWML